MLENKLFNIKDETQIIPVLATKMTSMDHNIVEENMLISSGYIYSGCKVLLTQLRTSNSTHDPKVWHRRILEIAHEFITNNFDCLKTGAEILIKDGHVC